MSATARGLLLSLVPGLLLVSCPRPAAALPPEHNHAAKPLVVLEIAGCPSVDRSQVRHLMAVELGARLVDGPGGQPAEPGGPGMIRAHVGCPDGEAAPAGLVELHIDDGVTGKALERTIDLTQQDPAVQPRLIALALSELVFASWAELLVTPRPTVRPAAPPPPDATREATSDRVAQKLSRPLPATGVYGSGLGGVLVLFAGTPVLAGGGLRLGGDHAHSLSWDAGFDAFHGDGETALGVVTTDLMSARVALLAHRRLPYLVLRGGAGLRVGAARLAGMTLDPNHVDARSIWGPWGGPLLGLELSVAAARMRVDLSLEGGYVLWSVGARVAGTPALAVEGPWLGVALGLGALLHRGHG